MSFNRALEGAFRYLINRTPLKSAHLSFREATGQNIDHLRRATLPDRFSAIYQNRVWLNSRPQGTLSGLGSELENTMAVRRQLPELLATLKTKTLLDVGCGDFNWMREVPLECAYVGIDCVKHLIDQNNALYSSSTRTFMTVDATTDALPCGDTVLCREVLFHLSFRDISALIRRIRACGAIYLIATTDVSARSNADIISGDFRILNLNRWPFYFPATSLSIDDDGVLPGRLLRVWSVSDLPV